MGGRMHEFDISGGLEENFSKEAYMDHKPQPPKDPQPPTTVPTGLFWPL